MIPALLEAHSVLVCVAKRLQSPFLLMVRLYWGWHFFLAGKGKLVSIEAVAQFFQELKIPMPLFNAYLAGATECFGGLLLVLGLFSRLTSLPLIFTMLVAYWTSENEALRSIFKNPDDFLGAAPFLFLFASLIVLIFGPGAFSIDRLIDATWIKKKGCCGEDPVD